MICAYAICPYCVVLNLAYLFYVKIWHSHLVNQYSRGLVISGYTNGFLGKATICSFTKSRYITSMVLTASESHSNQPLLFMSIINNTNHSHIINVHISNMPILYSKHVCCHHTVHSVRSNVISIEALLILVISYGGLLLTLIYPMHNCDRTILFTATMPSFTV